MNKFAQLKEYTDSIGSIYGTENISLYLYSLAKILEPRLVVDLGTGLGSNFLWLGTALKENATGNLITVDHGEDWSKFIKIRDQLGPYYREDYTDFIHNLIDEFDFGEEVSYVKSTIQDFNVDSEIDFLVSDFAHGPYDIVSLLAKYLPKMAFYSHIFIDSASTLYSSYHTLEKLIEQFNKGIIPLTLGEMLDQSGYDEISRLIVLSEFKLTHLIENKNRNQNSMAQIQISPRDIMPQPRVNIRF